MKLSAASAESKRRHDEARQGRAVLVRLSEKEAEAIDAARGSLTRPEWLRQKGVAAAKRAR